MVRCFGYVKHAEGQHITGSSVDIDLGVRLVGPEAEPLRKFDAIPAYWVLGVK